MKVAVTGCSFASTGSLQTAKVDFTVTNTGATARSASVGIEFRDGAGNRVDTDTAYVKTVAPGDTVRASESTILDASVESTGRCLVTSVR
jgi:hypothetical protein